MRLIDTIHQLGYPLRPQGRSWGGHKCPACGEGSKTSNRLSVYAGMDGKERWRCFVCGSGGDAADFIAAARGITLKEALRLTQAEPTVGNWTADNDSWVLLQQALKEIGVDDHEVRQYLHKRGISEGTIEAARQKGMLKMLPADPYKAKDYLYQTLGEECLRRAGLLKSRWPAIAFRPLVFTLPGGAAEFRRIDQGNDAHPKAIRYGRLAWPWFWKNAAKVQEVLVVEGPIDMLSLVEMGLAAGQAVMAVPGVSAWRKAWFSALAMKHPGVRLAIALDADESGERAAQTMLDAAREIGIPAQRRKPSAKDWNEHLLKGH